MTDAATLLTAALSYAAAGLRVFPVLAGRKEPATAHGAKDGTTDEAQIRAWWSELPYNIGIVCGPESGVFVIDIDPRNGGEWESPVPTATARSGGGGTHHYFQWPAGVAKMRRTLKPGVDVQGLDKYVLAPPSMTEGAYEWTSKLPFAAAPAALLAEIAIAEGAVTGQRPGDRFNAEHSWPDILTPYGWTVDHEDYEGVTYWTRPGKDEGVSATTNYMGSDLFYVFSTSTEFEAERGYDKFGVYAVLEHAGDISAAAAAISALNPRTTVSLAASPAAPNVAVWSPPSSAAATGYAYPTPMDHLLTQYIHYCGMLTDASPEYHEAAGLVMLSVLTAGMRVALAPFPDGLPTNLYVVLVGPSSVSRKSTAQGYAKAFMNNLRPNSLLGDRFSGEKAIAELAQRRVAVWMPDELGVMLQQMYQPGSYMRAVEDLLLSLYSGQKYTYSTLSGGETVIDGLDLSLLGAATPESFAGVGGRALFSGLLPRFGVVYPRHLPAARPPIIRTAEHDAWRDGLTARMRQVLDMCTRPGAPKAVTFDDAALLALSGLDLEMGATALTARLVTAAYKITAIIALADLRLEGNVQDATAAVAIVRRWAGGAVNLRRFLGRPAADVQHMEQVAIARAELRAMPAEQGADGRRVVSLRHFAARLSLPASTLKKLCETMESTGEIIIVSADGDEEVHYV